jgi:Flp pilus assembly protein TadD
VFGILPRKAPIRAAREVAVVSLGDLHQQIRDNIEAGEISRPFDICRWILSVRPDNLETMLLLAEIQLEAGEPQAAVRTFERVIASDPEDYLACAGLGIASESVGDAAAAAHWLDRALDLNPANHELRGERDRVFEMAYPGAPPPPALSGFAAARSLIASGFAAPAVDSLRLVLDEEPGRPEAKIALAEALWATDQFDEAAVLCNEVLEVTRRAVKPHALLAVIMAGGGDVVGAEGHLAEVHVQDPGGRIAGYILLESVLADRATERVDLRLPPMPRRVPRPQSQLMTPKWSRWMRDAMWHLLRLVRPAPDDFDSAPDLPLMLPRYGSGPLGRRLASAAGLPASPRDTEPATTAERVMVSEEVVKVRPLGNRGVTPRRPAPRSVVPPTPSTVAGDGGTAAAVSTAATNETPKSDSDSTEIIERPIRAPHRRSTDGRKTEKQV